MFKKPLFLLPLFCLSADLQAQPTEQLDSPTTPLNLQDNMPFAPMAETGSKVVTSMQETLVLMVQALAPALIALGKNQNLPIATEEIGQAILKTMELQYAKNANISINNQLNELKITGSYDKDDGFSKLRYEILRNLANTVITQNLMDEKNILDTKNTEEETSSSNILDIDNQPLNIEKFAIKKIGGKTFYAYTDSDKKKVFLVGNIGSYLNIRIQSEGPDSHQITRSFVEGLDYNALRKAIQDDNRPIEEIISDIEKKVNDPAVLQKLFEEQQQQEQ